MSFINTYTLHTLVIKMTIKYLVISGGQVNIMYHLGAIQYLHEKGFWNFADIKKIYATSSGCWLSILIALNIDWKLINDYVIKRPWNRVVSLNITQIYNIYNSKGIFDEEIVKTFFGPFFKIKDINIDITMKEFYELTQIEMHFYTFEVNKFEVVDLNWKTQPNMKILEALYMSSSIPFLFKPKFNSTNDDNVNNNVEDNNIKQPTHNDKCFIDGGVGANYPLYFCLQDPDVINRDEVFSLKNTYRNEDHTITENTDAIHFLFLLVNKIITNIDKITTSKCGFLKYEMEFFLKGINFETLTSFINDEEFRREILAKGIECGKEFYLKIQGSDEFEGQGQEQEQEEKDYSLLIEEQEQK